LCSAISKSFGIAVGGTVSGSIVICSIFEGTKVRVVELGEGFRPVKVLITRAWGFIVTLAVMNTSGKQSSHIFVHNVNGRFIRKVEVPFVVAAWADWPSRKGFDYIIIGTETGRLFWSEAFYCRFADSVYRYNGVPVAVSYLVDAAVAVTVWSDGHMTFLPLVVE
jgi:hypothetical protein